MKMIIAGIFLVLVGFTFISIGLITPAAISFSFGAGVLVAGLFPRTFKQICRENDIE